MGELLAAVSVKGARVPSVLAQCVQSGNDAACEVTRRERRRHRHRAEGRSPVVEVASCDCPREDLKTPVRGVDHNDHRAVSIAAKGTE